MGVGLVTKPSSLIPPSTKLDFICRMRANTEIWARVNRLVLVVIKVAAHNTVAKPVLALKATAELTVGSIDAFRAIIPLAWFVKGEFRKHETTDTVRVINSADLYLGIVEVTSWIDKNASGLAEFARSVGTSYPLVGRVISVNLAKIALPVALTLFTAILVENVGKFRTAHAAYKLVAGSSSDEKKAEAELHKTEMWMAALKVTWSLGHISLTALEIAALTNPVIAPTVIALEIGTILVGLTSDSYSVLNPEIK